MSGKSLTIIQGREKN